MSNPTLEIICIAILAVLGLLLCINEERQKKKRFRKRMPNGMPMYENPPPPPKKKEYDTTRKEQERELSCID